MNDAFSLRDHLFNAESLGDLAAEYAAGCDGFDPHIFLGRVLPGLAPLGLLERLDWIADCIAEQLPTDFPAMADSLEAAMPPPLNPNLRDNDFGRFIHAVPGVLAVRHGLAAHPDRALDLLYEATKRFSMELYIRPFINQWPDKTLARLCQWAEDENYHVRRLVSEGTRPKLPWARSITLDPLVALPLLDILHDDSTRYVTRSVANHLNDIAKIAPDAVLDRLSSWRESARGTASETRWISRHALRTLIKQGYPPALRFLGYRPDAAVEVAALDLAPDEVAIDTAMTMTLTLKNTASKPKPVLVDYAITFASENGKPRQKVFKWKEAEIAPSSEISLRKSHRFKGNATTFSLTPGRHQIAIQVNGKRLLEKDFDLLPSPRAGGNSPPSTS